MQIRNLNLENIRKVAGLFEHQQDNYDPNLHLDVLKELENMFELKSKAIHQMETLDSG